MRLAFYLFSIVLVGFIFSIQISAQPLIECPAKQLVMEKVNFHANDCHKTEMLEYVMNGRTVWVTMPITIPKELIKSQQPIGLFISGHMSNRVYLNGTRIGQNGTSSITPENEVEGKLDWVAYVPHSTIKDEKNQLTMHISSFNSQVEYLNPFNRLYVDVYQASTIYYLKHYIPTLIPLGVMLLSLIYIVRRLLLEPKSLSLIYLLIITLTATLQLFTEIYRGFYAYGYSLHYKRLDLIWLFSLIFGLALLTQSLHQFTQIKKRLPICVWAGLIIILRLEVTEPDLQAAYTMLIPAFLAASLIAFEQFKNKERGFVPSLVLLAFGVLIYIAPYNFLDVYLYYCIAALLAYLFTEEAKNRVQQQNQLMLETQRAEKLQLALDMKTEENIEQKITLKDSGKLIKIKVEDILFCQGAGDYVEVCLTDRTILHSGSLSGMTEELPSYFIKVHRSYLVNAKQISHMRRLPAGTGEIEVSNGHIVPVSRRLLPRLKETLVTE
jgi:hypothetical protein